MKLIAIAALAAASLMAQAPSIYSSKGKYLGNLSANKYDPNSVSNPYGRYGSRYSPDSINNPYGTYGSRYSNESANNPYATQAPRVYAAPTMTPLPTIKWLTERPSFEYPYGR